MDDNQFISDAQKQTFAQEQFKMVQVTTRWAIVFAFIFMSFLVYVGNSCSTVERENTKLKERIMFYETLPNCKLGLEE